MGESKDQDIVVDKETPPEQPLKDDKSVDGKSDTSTLQMIEIDGEKIPFTEDEFRKGYSRNKDYTQSKQKLSTREKEVESYEQMSQWLNDPANAESAQKIRDIVEGKAPPVSLEDEELLTDDQKEIRSLRGIVDVLDGKIKNLSSSTEKDKNDAVLREVGKEVTEAQEKFKLSDEDMDTVMGLARNGANVVKTAETFVKNRDKRDKVVIKEYLNKKETDKEDAPFISGNLPPQTPGEKVSLDDGSAKKRFAGTIAKIVKAAKE